MKLVIKSALLLISVSLSGLTASAEEQRSCEDIMAEGYTHGIQMLKENREAIKRFQVVSKERRKENPSEQIICENLEVSYDLFTAAAANAVKCHAIYLKAEKVCGEEEAERIDHNIRTCNNEKKVNARNAKKAERIYNDICI